MDFSQLYFIIIVSKQCKNWTDKKKIYQFRTCKRRLAHLLQLPEKGKIDTTTTTVRKMQLYSSHCSESVSSVKCKNKFQQKINSFNLKLFSSEMLPSPLYSSISSSELITIVSNKVISNMSEYSIVSESVYHNASIMHTLLKLAPSLGRKM